MSNAAGFFVVGIVFEGGVLSSSSKPPWEPQSAHRWCAPTFAIEIRAWDASCTPAVDALPGIAPCLSLSNRPAEQLNGGCA